MPFEVQVTQDHIDRGETGCRTCPIALAFRELFPTMLFEVHPTLMFVHAFDGPMEDFTRIVRWPVPGHIGTWIMRHDEDKKGIIDRPARPITFEVEILSYVH